MGGYPHGLLQRVSDSGTSARQSLSSSALPASCAWRSLWYRAEWQRAMHRACAFSFSLRVVTRPTPRSRGGVRRRGHVAHRFRFVCGAFMRRLCRFWCRLFPVLPLSKGAYARIQGVVISRTCGAEGVMPQVFRALSVRATRSPLCARVTVVALAPGPHRGQSPAVSRPARLVADER